MIKTIKVDYTQYIKKCKYCKSEFIYDMDAIVDSYSYDYVKKIRCPHCRNNNKIRFKRKYKKQGEVEKEYKNEISKLNIDIKERDKALNVLRDEIRDLNKDNKKISRKVSKIQNYIDELLSNNVNNLAKKYIIRISDIVKEGDD